MLPLVNPKMQEAVTTIRRVGIVGDVHAEDVALATVLRFLLAVPNLDALLCTGDIMDGHTGTNAARCCELLQSHGVLTVRGNHDRWFLSDTKRQKELPDSARDFLSSLPRTRTFQTPQGTLLLCHGVGVDDMELLSDFLPDTEITALLHRHCADTYAFHLAGHTHHRLVRAVNTTVLLNPGTLQWGYEPCFAVADFEAGTVQFYDIDHDNRMTITKAQTFRLNGVGEVSEVVSL